MSVSENDLLNSQQSISFSYGLEPAETLENSISGDYESDEMEESLALPLPGTMVMRRSHIYRGKTYPEVLARVIRATGLGLEAITDLGARYRFDLSDWLDTWFPLLE